MTFEDFVNSVEDLDVVEEAKDYEVLIEKRVDIKIRGDAEDVEELADDFETVEHVRTKEFVDGCISTYSVAKQEEEEDVVEVEAQ